MNVQTNSKVGRGRWVAVALMVAGLSGLAVQVMSFPTPVALPQANPDQTTFFETRVRPVLVAKCLPCHGPTTQLANLRLDTAEGVAKGGDTGAAVSPGDPDKSLIIQAVRQTGQLKMPQGGRLSAPEIADLESWVKMGAPWPKNSTHEEAKKAFLWSLEPVQKPKLPRVKHGDWVKNGIDTFVLAKLEANGLVPAPQADRRTLIRRLSYDLTGLPPSPEEVDAYVKDKSPTAYEKIVDRLLSSPRYGERWARHWMDVARYSDTKGYVFNEDRNYPNAYTYRDWLINAFNRDLPYDQFIIRQLAADRVPEVENGEDKHDLAALGFLTDGRRFLNIEPDIIDDRIDTTMRGLEGFTVACARCHDHKFDPIPTQDYYSLYAVFASSREVSVPISEKSISQPWLEYNRNLGQTQQSLQALIAAQVKRLRTEEDSPETSSSLSGEVKKTLQSLNPNDLPTGPSLDVLSRSFEPAPLAQIKALGHQLDQMKAEAPPTPEFAMAMEDKPNPSDGVVFKRGNAGNPGEPAPRRFLLALSKPGTEREHWTKDSGRLELAEAIASRTNPLTARVFVNRAWLSHFGTGIVRTPSDFGHQGEPPTDPQLLDYLAATFMENGWSMKRLQRLIVTSATYRQSSSISAKTFNRDPDNRLWSRMNRQRLDLEEMRDSFMFAAGRLDTHDVGGKSVDIWSKPFSARRAVYGFIERQNLPGIFRTFDLATPDSTSPKRFVTTVPQQALFFMNSPFVMDEAKSVAARPEIAGASDDGQRIRRLYRDLFDRLPTQEETQIGLGYLDHRSDQAVVSPASVWKYGFGGYDESRKTTVGFTPFAVFAKSAYHPTEKLPDPDLGFLLLSASGGHPGRDGSHAAIRRWVAPSAMTINVTGLLSHRQPQGDGVRGRLVSSRLGLLGEWKVHNGEAHTDFRSLAVQPGDTLDFMVDPLTNDGYDSFGWAPTIEREDGGESWVASANFGPPDDKPVTRLTLYAQALMMTNEFMFID